MTTVAVDFDGVIHSYDRGWRDGSIYGEPVAGAFDALQSLMQDYAVMIHTSRDSWAVAEWIEAHSGIPCVYDEKLKTKDLKFWNTRGQLLVTSRKLPASAYIDDRAIRFESWSQALADLYILVEG